MTNETRRIILEIVQRSIDRDKAIRCEYARADRVMKQISFDVGRREAGNVGDR